MLAWYFGRVVARFRSIELVFPLSGVHLRAGPHMIAFILHRLQDFFFVGDLAKS